MGISCRFQVEVAEVKRRKKRKRRKRRRKRRRSAKVAKGATRFHRGLVRHCYLAGSTLAAVAKNDGDAVGGE